VKQTRRSPFARLVRFHLWALLAALVAGFVIGLAVRRRLEAPPVHMGAAVRPFSVAAAPTRAR